MNKTTNIRVTVKLIPHPEPQRLVDLWANMALKEIEKREKEGTLQSGRDSIE